MCWISAILVVVVVVVVVRHKSALWWIPIVLFASITNFPCARPFKSEVGFFQTVYSDG